MLVSCCVRSGMISSIPSIVDCYRTVRRKRRRERDGVSVGDTASEGIASRDDGVARVLTAVLFVARVVWPCGWPWPTIWASLTSRRGRQSDRAAEGEASRRRFPPFVGVWMQWLLLPGMIEVEEFDRGELS